MEFTKLTVPTARPAAPPRSLLSSALSTDVAGLALNSGRISPGGGATTPTSREGRAAGESSSSTNSPKRVGFTVGRVIAAILEAFFEAGCEVTAAGPGRPSADRFSLLVAEDDGCLADPDFPEVRGALNPRPPLPPFPTARSPHQAKTNRSPPTPPPSCARAPPLSPRRLTPAWPSPPWG